MKWKSDEKKRGKATTKTAREYLYVMWMKEMMSLLALSNGKMWEKRSKIFHHHMCRAWPTCWTTLNRTLFLSLTQCTSSISPNHFKPYHYLYFLLLALLDIINTCSFSHDVLAFSLFQPILKLTSRTPDTTGRLTKELGKTRVFSCPFYCPMTAFPDKDNYNRNEIRERTLWWMFWSYNMQCSIYVLAYHSM